MMLWLLTAASARAEPPLFEDNFQNLDAWHLEGRVEGVTVSNGVLRLDCTGSQQGGTGTMAFTKRDFPDHIVIEYDLVVEHTNGLLITFVAMQGTNGEDAITGVPKRTGVFDDYTGPNASTRSYHVSVCRYDDKGVHTGVSNWRRNPGLHLMASGKDLCTETGKPYHIAITKRGPYCDIRVNGQLGASFTDPQTLPGPIPTAGKIGFRAIGSRAVFRISNFKVTPAAVTTWTADNGNGTFSNPLFYDEFSDPDLIRVGGDFYLTGTTMHAMPGLPVLHSRDLVNWKWISYACERLDLGPEFRLEDGQTIYGQGFWAPCLRYHNGTFHIFSNVNGRKTQLFSAKNPAGPWTRTEMNRSFHDLSVLFDDDGKAYVIWGYQEIRLAQLTDDLKDVVPGTERVIIPKDAGMGEGSHFYKINGKYYITSAWWDRRMRMPCARADKPEGPYEVNPEISADEDFGLAEGLRLRNARQAPPFEVGRGNPTRGGRLSMHQGGIVDTPTGEWWGFSMMDANSVGRLTCLSPVTWKDGWPYFGLPGNLKRTPRIWVKPNTGHHSPPTAPYERNDDFSGNKLKPIWQWNHAPDNTKWSLTERPGWLRLHSLPATDFWRARNTLTQRAIGPQSTPTVVLDVTGMKDGDVAGLALLNFPYAWIGVSGKHVVQFDQMTGKTNTAPLPAGKVWLRAQCDFLTEKARFSFSADGNTFQTLGDEFAMIFQLRTFQGVRYSLFHFNTTGAPGGHADFDNFTVHEPHPRGLMKPIPFGQTISLTATGAVLAVDGATRFKVVDRGLGRVALQAGDRFVSVSDAGRVALAKDAGTFQWMENMYGDVMLLSLATHRYLRIGPFADSVGPRPDRKDGSCFTWETKP